MQILRILTLVGVAVIASQRSGPEIVAVRAVVDGDTIEVANYGRIGLAGIKAPRLWRNGLEGEPFARRARERLEAIVAQRFVRVEFPSPASRSSAYVLLEDGTFVNAVLVAEGLARVTARGGGARAEELRRAQERAQRARLGIWSALADSATPQLRNSQLTPNSSMPKTPKQERETPNHGRKG